MKLHTLNIGRVLVAITKSTKEESVERVQQMKKPDNVHAPRAGQAM